MDDHITQIVDNCLAASNEARQQSEVAIKTSRAENGEQFLQALLKYAVAQADDAKAMFAFLLLKKLYLDDRQEEDGLWKPNNEQITILKNAVSESINFEANSINLLKRKAEVICKCFRKLETYDEMI